MVKMSTRRFLLGFLALASVGLLASCDLFEGSPGFTSNVTSGQIKYYSLKNGFRIDNPASQSWDIAFGPGSQEIYTNSGVTASETGSGGAGGVRYTGTKVFAEVSGPGTIDFADKLSTDQYYYTQTQFQNGGEKLHQRLNKMTYLNYQSGDGSEGSPLQNDGVSSSVYEGDAYYGYYFAVGVSPSKEVYVIRHGDGINYSKVQIVGVSGGPSNRTWAVKYTKF